MGGNATQVGRLCLRSTQKARGGVSPNWQSAMIDAELERHAERASFAYGSVPRWVLPDAQLTLNIPSTEGTQASCHTSLSNRRAPKPLGARLVRIRPRGRRALAAPFLRVVWGLPSIRSG